MIGGIRGGSGCEGGIKEVGSPITVLGSRLDLRVKASRCFSLLHFDRTLPLMVRTEDREGICVGRTFSSFPYITTSWLDVAGEVWSPGNWLSPCCLSSLFFLLYMFELLSSCVPSCITRADGKISFVWPILPFL